MMMTNSIMNFAANGGGSASMLSIRRQSPNTSANKFAKTAVNNFSTISDINNHTATLPHINM